MRGPVRLQLPISQSRLTAIGYHSAGDGALSLHPVGHQANEGLVSRVVHGIFGGGGGSPTWYQLGGGGSTSALDVGAAAWHAMSTRRWTGSSPRSGPSSSRASTYGSEIDIQPQNAPSVVVAVTQLVADPALNVGTAVVSGATKLGARRRPRDGRAASTRALHERRREPRDRRGAPGSGPRDRLGRHRSLKILFLADVFGVPGRRAVEEHLPALRERYDADLAIVNGENAADGAGITAKLADKLLAAGADVVTLGNHTYRRSGIASYLAGSERVIRPAN